MSDRVCVRGCVQPNVHYAACARSGPEWQAKSDACTGCAPAKCRDGSMICDRCFGRLRRLIGDIPDLLARLRSIADPSKATPTDQVRTPSTLIEAPAPVGDDLLDAIHAVERAAWLTELDLLNAQNNEHDILDLWDYLTIRHAPEDGIRSAWSVQDAIDRWGVERRDPNAKPYEAEADRAEIREPVTEWGDPIIGREHAEALAGSPSTLRRWIKSEEITPVGTIWIAGIRTRLFRRSEVIATRDRMRGQQQAGQYKPQTGNA